MKTLIPALALIAAPAFGNEITPQDIFGLPPAEVMFLGELHDNPWHHQIQAQVVAARSARALVFEMLTPEQAAKAEPELLADQEALDRALGWAQSGWPDFGLYYPIFAAAQGMAIYGAQVPRDAVRAAIMGGDVAADFGPQAARYGLSEALDPEEQAAREALQLQAHCNALPAAMLPGMVLGQRLRDATLARAIDRALAETGGPVLVITGNGHARTDWGAPRLLSAQTTRISIAQLEAVPDGPQPFDFWIVTQEAARQDPCLAFSGD